MTGLFITCEGGEGSGKTTQLRLLAEALEKRGRKPVVTREPGGGAGGDAIRALLLTGKGDKWAPETETLLFLAARAEHVARVIRPALAEGRIVLCDRFIDSTLVYQGLGRGLGVEYLRQLHRLAIPRIEPDLTLLFDIPVEEGLARAARRSGDETRFESLDRTFHQRVREGFLALAKAEPQRFRVIDGAAAQSKVHEQVMKLLEGRLI